ncbi:MAG: AAA family ATPase, partial [Caldisericia bacterium]|nr:AAA family ATPase [Caldisericia bacterium]
MNKELLKEVIVSNENYIKSIDLIVERECVKLPSSLRKVVIFYGVRRSGKTFILFDLYKKHKDNAVYIDFE